MDSEAAARGFSTPPRAASPSSSQGSWVVDPEDGGWDGVGVSPPHSPTPYPPHSLPPTPEQRQRLLPSPAVASPLRSWAQVPQSPPPVAQYPTMSSINSPPQSPASVRSSGGGSAAGEGLVGLVRDEISDEMEISEAAPVACPSVPSPSRGASSEREGAVVVVGCTEIGEEEDVDMVDVRFSDGVVEAPAVVVSAGRTAAEAAEAIAEAGELVDAAGEEEALLVLSDHVSRVVASPPRTWTGTVTAEAPLPVRSAAAHATPAGTPPRIASPPRTRVTTTVTTNTNAGSGVSCGSCCAEGPRSRVWFGCGCLGVGVGGGGC